MNIVEETWKDVPSYEGYYQVSNLGRVKCEHYHIHKWGEPPLEPNESGTLHTENQCKIKKGNPEVFCNGDLSFCDALTELKNRLESEK